MKCPKCEGTRIVKRGTDIRVSGRVRRLQCKDCGYKTSVPLYDVTDSGLGAIENKSRYVITSAVSASPVHKPFLETLKVYCKQHDAQLLIIPLRYRNPTTPAEQGANSVDNWYALEVREYLYSRRESPIAGLRVMGDIKTQPTATRPLSGLDSLTGGDCGIFGHTKVSMESIPTKGHDLPKLLYTTGAVTKPAYSDTKAGAKGEFHHTLGAVVVERDEDLFHLRHILPNQDGSFYDLNAVYSAAGVSEGKPIPALIAGDLHAERHDPDNLEATFMAKDSITSTLKPRRIVLHDALDFQSASHHNNFFDRFKLRHAGRDDVREELDHTLSLIDRIAERCDEVVMVDSNHNQHFMRWLESDRNANDPQNAQIFAETRAGILPEIIEKGYCDPLEWWARKGLKNYPKVRFMPPGESYSIHGIELAYHGDRGPNGARGSAMSLSKIGSKSVIGHSHAPKIVDGCYQTGTSSLLDLGYNQGAPSSWLHSHVIIYPNGKRTHIHVINGRWRGNCNT